MTNEHYFEVAKECGAVTLGDKEWKDGPRLVITGECLDTYTARICAEKDEEIEHWKNAAYQADRMRMEQAQKLSAANAAIAMKDEALKEASSTLECFKYSLDGVLQSKLLQALSTTPESIAAWEAEKRGSK